MIIPESTKIGKVFKNRRAYLIGFDKPVMGLKGIKDMESHLDSAKNGLLKDWGF